MQKDALQGMPINQVGQKLPNMLSVFNQQKMGGNANQTLMLPIPWVIAKWIFVLPYLTPLFIKTNLERPTCQP